MASFRDFYPRRCWRLTFLWPGRGQSWHAASAQVECDRAIGLANAPEERAFLPGKPLDFP